MPRRTRPDSRGEMLAGTLDMLVLKTLALYPIGRSILMHLTAQRSRWESFVQAVVRVLGPATE